MYSASEQGFVQVYTGNGKGKTTAALGLCMRALGRGKRVCFFQFIKGSGPYGEHVLAKEHLPMLTMVQTGKPGWVNLKDITEDRRIAQKAFTDARQMLLSGDYDLFVCDEINGAVAFGLIDLEQVLALIHEKPRHTELILTGRSAAPEVIEAANLVTEMKEIKHYYTEGVPARIGIEM